MTGDKDHNERIRELQKLRNKIDAEIKHLDSRTAKSRFKREARRQYLAGRAVLDLAGKDENFAQVLFKILEAALTGTDRGLFELDSDLQNSFGFNAADYSRKPKPKPKP